MVEKYQKIGYDDYLFISIISFRLYKKHEFKGSIITDAVGVKTHF